MKRLLVGVLTSVVLLTGCVSTTSNVTTESTPSAESSEAVEVDVHNESADQGTGQSNVSTDMTSDWVAKLSCGSGEVMYDMYVYDHGDDYVYQIAECATKSLGSTELNRKVVGSGFAADKKELVQIFTDKCGDADGYAVLAGNIDKTYSFSDFAAMD